MLLSWGKWSIKVRRTESSSLYRRTGGRSQVGEGLRRTPVKGHLLRRHFLLSRTWVCTLTVPCSLRPSLPFFSVYRTVREGHHPRPRPPTETEPQPGFVSPNREVAGGRDVVDDDSVDLVLRRYSCSNRVYSVRRCSSQVPVVCLTSPRPRDVRRPVSGDDTLLTGTGV